MLRIYRRRFVATMPMQHVADFRRLNTKAATVKNLHLSRPHTRTPARVAGARTFGVYDRYFTAMKNRS